MALLGEEITYFIGRCPIEGDVDGWVAENVLPQMEGITENYSSYEELLGAFMRWRATVKGDAVEIVHMGVPVEARLFIDAHTMGIIGDWDGPYPLIDIAAFPEIWDSVDRYNGTQGLPHNPLYDAIVAAVAYRHWLANYKI